MVERLTVDEEVVGSTPIRHPKQKANNKAFLFLMNYEHNFYLHLDPILKNLLIIIKFGS